MKKLRKLLSCLLTFTLVAALMVGTGTNVFADSVVAKSVAFGAIELNAATPYWVNGAAAATADSEGANASFDAATGTLTLSNAVIDSNGIEADGNLTVNLTGTNAITSTGNGINATGNLNISGGKLIISSAVGANYALCSDKNMTLTGVDLDLTSADDAIYVETGVCTLTDCTGTVKSANGCGIYVDYGYISMSGCDMQFDSESDCLYGYDAAAGEYTPCGLGDVVIKDCTLTLISGSSGIDADDTFFDIENSDITITADTGLLADYYTSIIKNSTLDITSVYCGINTIYGDLLINASKVKIQTAAEKNFSRDICGIRTGGTLTITDNAGATGSARHIIDISCGGIADANRYFGIYCEDTLSLSGSLLKVRGQTASVYWEKQEELNRTYSPVLVLEDGYEETYGNVLTKLNDGDIADPPSSSSYSSGGGYMALYGMNPDGGITELVPGEKYAMAKGGAVATQIALQPDTYASELEAENEPEESEESEEPKDDNPATGDSTAASLWIMFALAGITGIAFALRQKKRTA